MIKLTIEEIAEKIKDSTEKIKESTIKIKQSTAKILRLYGYKKPSKIEGYGIGENMNILIYIVGIAGTIWFTVDYLTGVADWDILLMAGVFAALTGGNYYLKWLDHRHRVKMNYYNNRMK